MLLPLHMLSQSQCRLGGNSRYIAPHPAFYCNNIIISVNKRLVLRVIDTEKLMVVLNRRQYGNHKFGQRLPLLSLARFTQSHWIETHETPPTSGLGKVDLSTILTFNGQ